MNKVELMGRLTRDPDISYSGEGDKQLMIARYTLAVDRRVKKDQESSADFISCIAFGKNAEFAQSYLHKGIKIAVCGHIQTGSFTNKDGVKIYTTSVVVDEHEFAESKNAGNGNWPVGPAPEGSEFMQIPDDIDEELPFV